MTRLRAAWRTFRTGLTYEHGLAQGQDEGFEAAFNDITRDLDRVVHAHLNPQPRPRPQLTLVAGGAR